MFYIFTYYRKDQTGVLCIGCSNKATAVRALTAIAYHTQQRIQHTESRNTTAYAGCFVQHDEETCVRPYASRSCGEFQSCIHGPKARAKDVHDAGRYRP